MSTDGQASTCGEGGGSKQSFGGGDHEAESSSVRIITHYRTSKCNDKMRSNESPLDECIPNW